MQLVCVVSVLDSVFAFEGLRAIIDSNREIENVISRGLVVVDIAFFHDFKVLADKKNFSEAAKELFISQSTLSKHISALEKEYGVRLFDRDKYHVELTVYGSELLETARLIWRSYSRSKTAIAKSIENHFGIRVGGNFDNPDEYGFVSHVFSVIRERVPSASPSIVPCQTAFVSQNAQRIASGEVDCACLYYDACDLEEAELDMALFKSTYLGLRPVFALMKTDHPLACKPALTVDDLDGCTLTKINGPRFSPIWSQIARRLQAAGISYAVRQSRFPSYYEYSSYKVEDDVFLLPYAGHYGILSYDASHMVVVPFKDDFCLRDNVLSLASNDSDILKLFLDIAAREHHRLIEHGEMPC